MPQNKTQLQEASPGQARFVEDCEGYSSGGWCPNTDVFIRDDQLVVNIELAGLSRSALKLGIEGSRIRVSGNRPDTTRSSKCKFSMMEIDYGRFERVIDIPPGFDMSKAEATYENGFLRVTIPPSTAGQSKPLPVW